jgi:hypothetical protein
MVERQVTAAQADGCPWPHAAMSNQLRKSSRTPSQISFRTTNDHKAGVCECFERRHHRAADGRNRPGRPQLQGLEELPPPNLRSNPGQLLPRAAVRTANRRQWPACRPPHVAIIEGTIRLALRCGPIGMLRIGVLAAVKALRRYDEWRGGLRIGPTGL